MSNVDISYGELILIDTFDAGAGIVGAAQAAVAYAIQKDTHGHQPLVAISAETFYFSNNLSIGGQIDLSGTINFNELDVSGDATLDASLNVKGNSYLRGKLEVNEIGALEKATTGGVDTFRLANIDNISDISYALQQMKTGETAINSGNNLSLKIGGDDMLSINAAGNVGIGTTTPSKSLEVVGDISCQNLYANARITKTRYREIINFDVADRMFNYSGQGNWSAGTVKYIPLARLGTSDSMTVKGIIREAGGNGIVCKVDLIFSTRFTQNYTDVVVHGSITGKLTPNTALVLFSNREGWTYSQSTSRWWLYFVTSNNFSHFVLNITGTNVDKVWPGPTNTGLDEHSTTNQLTSFPPSRGSYSSATDLGTGAHSLDINTPASGIRTMYTTNRLYDSGDSGGAHIAVTHHETDNAGDNVITKFPGDVSCVDLYSNKILTPSGNNKLYIVPNLGVTADHRIIHLGLMGGDEPIVGQLRFGRALDATGSWMRHHSIKVQSDKTYPSNNYMRFDLHNGSDGDGDVNGETLAEQVNVMTLRGDGRVGIGTTTPSQALEVVGDISCQNLYVGSMIQLYNMASDDRIKFDEKNVNECMALVNELVPFRYNIISKQPDDASGIWMPTDASWNDVSNNFNYKNQYGFIAQDVGDISGLEMLVKGEPLDACGNQTILSLEYNSLFTIGIGAIKELHQLISSQATTISALEARVRILENS